MPEVIVIGSGTGIPSLSRASPAILIKTKDKTILLDSGPGTLRELLKINLHFSKLDLILYTHLHPDHTADLIHFLFASKYSPEFQRKAPVFIGGPRGFLAFYNKLKAAFGQYIETVGNKIILIEIPPSSLWAYEDIYIEPFTTPHTENSQGYCLDYQGKKIVYTGDTDYDEKLAEIINGADLLICEASFPSKNKVEGHLTPALAGKLANKAKVKCLLLTHFYPECEEVDIIDECRKSFSATLFLANDLAHIKI
jgi:ribonuclease BN (tRNA processing enzyme)